MRRVDSMQDQMARVATYELSNGDRVRLSLDVVEDIGAAECIRRMGLGHLLPKDRLPVIQCGRRVGTLPPDFDPMAIKSRSFLYDPRPGDFRLEGKAWVASPTLGGGDFECIPGFEREPVSS